MSDPDRSPRHVEGPNTTDVTPPLRPPRPTSLSPGSPSLPGVGLEVHKGVHASRDVSYRLFFHRLHESRDPHTHPRPPGVSVQGRGYRRGNSGHGRDGRPPGRTPGVRGPSVGLPRGIGTEVGPLCTESLHERRGSTLTAGHGVKGVVSPSRPSCFRLGKSGRLFSFGPGSFETSGRRTRYRTVSKG